MVSPGPLGPPRSSKEDTANSGKHLWISDMAGGWAYLSSGDRRAAPVTATLWIATTEGKLPDPSGRAQDPRPTQANTAKLLQGPPLTSLPAMGSPPIFRGWKEPCVQKGSSRAVQVPTPCHACLWPSPLPQWLPGASPLLLRPWYPPAGPCSTARVYLHTFLPPWTASQVDAKQTHV